MNTLKIEAMLADKYKYKPLSADLSKQYREYYKQNIPSWLRIQGAATPLYTANGTIITYSYDRIVIGDYGAFIEFSLPSSESNLHIAPGQEYRVYDERYNKRVKYIWLTIDSNIKIYYQKRTVTYADYLPDKYYVSVHEVYKGGK